ncbi:DUF4097 family beta strand repeat-containing protein [Mucilaginibacter lappiensis]|uniref:DUF4097 family beta strand repeat-containing protein n=1 Tax=Mucilaginibacter lappiensis TaxID=354630 RepID=UPI003D1C78B9
MKRLLIPVLAGAGLCFAQISASAQEFKQHVSKQFTLQKGVVAIYNISGSINVEGYSGDKVIMEIEETISADDQATLEQGKKEFKLAFDQKQDTVMAYIAEPYDSRPRHNWNRGHDDREIHYQYNLEFTVKVPFNMDLKVSTVNNGHITVKDVYGALKVNNVNGPIDIVNAKGTTDAHTVNGAVTANYLKIPSDASSYRTINGEVKITYPASLAADLEFKSMNGQFYTDFPDAEVMPGKVIKTQSKSSNGTVYKLSKNSDVRIGAGGKTFKFETLNGNIYIKKQQ